MSRTYEQLKELQEQELYERVDMEYAESMRNQTQVYAEIWSDFQKRNPDANYGEWKYGKNLVDWDEEPQE